MRKLCSRSIVRVQSILTAPGTWPPRDARWSRHRIFRRRSHVENDNIGVVQVGKYIVLVRNRMGRSRGIEFSVGRPIDPVLRRMPFIDPGPQPAVEEREARMANGIERPQQSPPPCRFPHCRRRSCGCWGSCRGMIAPQRVTGLRGNSFIAGGFTFIIAWYARCTALGT